MEKRKIGFEICHCSRLIRRYTDSVSAKSRADEVTGMHGWALGYFYHNRHKDVYQKDFEAEFDIRRSTASNILALMEKNGLITRESVPHDARLKKIVLTEKAMRIHCEIDETFRKMEEGLAENISEEELEVFFATADKIRKNIERMTE